MSSEPIFIQVLVVIALLCPLGIIILLSAYCLGNLKLIDELDDLLEKRKDH